MAHAAKEFYKNPPKIERNEEGKKIVKKHKPEEKKGEEHMEGKDHDEEMMKMMHRHSKERLDMGHRHESELMSHAHKRMDEKKEAPKESKGDK
jgi:hypothetical protein